MHQERTEHAITHPACTEHAPRTTLDRSLKALGPVGLPPWQLLLACLLPLALCALLHMLAQRGGPQAQPGVLALERVQIYAQGGLEPPPMLAPDGVPRTLPLAPGRQQVRQPLWLLLPFELAQTPQDVWTLRVAHRRQLLVYLNGRLLGQSVPPAQIDQRSPELKLGQQTLHLNVPPDWLQPGPQLVQLRLGAADSPSVVSVHLGPASAVAQLDHQRDILTALRTTTALGALVVGLFLIGIWLAHREALAYALAGAHLLLLALLLSPYLLAHQPLPSPWWRMLLDVADVGAKALLLATVVRLARPHDAWGLRVAWAYAVAGVLVDGAAAALDQPWTDFSSPWPWWALGSRFAVLGLAVVLALRALARQPRGDRFATASLVGLSWVLWTYVSWFALVSPQHFSVVDLNVVGHAAWVLWMGSLLYRHFVQTARRERVLRQEANEALAQRTRELQDSFAALQASERLRLAAAERERLLQEMHDGLGSLLMTAKMSAQTGQMSGPEMATALDSCIQELRLTVDTLSVADGDLGLLLASVRHRSEAGLRAAGLALVWQVAEAPCLPVLQGSGGRELVRILQEGLSNVLHHAQATRVTLKSEASPDGQHIVVSLVDNGRGLPGGRPPQGGRGTRNMLHRAQRLGAGLSWQSPANGQLPGLGGPGTELRIELPLQALAAVPAPR